MNTMVNNDVCDEVRDVMEMTITAVVRQASTIGNEKSPLPLTPRMNLNRTSPQSGERQKDRHARKSSFPTTAPLIAPNNTIGASKATIEIDRIDDTPTYNSPIDNLQLSESLAEKLFSQGYDSNGLKAEYSNVDFEMEKCETYNNINLGGNDIAEAVVHMGATE